MIEPKKSNRREFLNAAGKTAVAAGVVIAAGGSGEPLAPPDKQPLRLPMPTPPHPRVGFAVVGLGELALEDNNQIK